MKHFVLELPCRVFLSTKFLFTFHHKHADLISFIKHWERHLENCIIYTNFLTVFASVLWILVHCYPPLIGRGMNYLRACGIKVLLVVKKTPLCILNKGCEHFVHQRSEHALIVPPVERTSLMMFVTSSPTGVMSPPGINCYHCHCQIVSSHWQCLWVPRFICVLHVSCVVKITDMNSCNLADLCKASTWTVHGAILRCICRESNSNAKKMCVYYCESIVWMGVFLCLLPPGAHQNTHHTLMRFSEPRRLQEASWRLLLGDSNLRVETRMVGVWVTVLTVLGENIRVVQRETQR